MTKYIFVTGGVISSLGKGIASASIAKILEARGLKVSLIKLDPYINVDPGTMNPYQHGEVYVTNDGAETDLDLGHYERFTNARIKKINNVTSGQIYSQVISKERRGDYLGKTIQVIPHITNEIKSCIKRAARSDRLDILLIEIGGTVGDIESLPFLEAARQFKLDVGRDNVLYIHLTLVPFIKAAHELKTKPTQHSVGTLREIGIEPDILLCRTEKSLDEQIKSKISLFCNVPTEAVIEAKDVSSIYKIPIVFKSQNLDELILKRLQLKKRDDDLAGWRKNVIDRIDNPDKHIKVAVVGKYIELQDAYKSIYEALTHAAIANNARLELKRIDSQELESDNYKKILADVDAILIPGGFGQRGIEGKIRAVTYAREHSVPFFGICLGMQCAVIEFARNVLGFAGANSTEFDPHTRFPVISLLTEQKKVKDMGGSMRLGAYPCRLYGKSLSRRIYSRKNISERHRHRYEFNNRYKDIFKKAGMLFSGVYPLKGLIEIVELENHPWFIGVQFHPEFKSKPDRAHPLFKCFIKTALRQKSPRLTPQ